MGLERGWRDEDLDYLQDLGFHLIPLGPGKKPLVRWRKGEIDYVQHRPTRDEIATWSEHSPESWAVVCGGPPRIVVLDIEAAGWLDTASKGIGIREVFSSLPASCIRRSPSGGRHAYLRVTDGPAPGARRTRLVLRREGDETILLAELRAEGHIAGILGPGRGDLSSDFHPHNVTMDELDQILSRLRALSDVHQEAQASAPSRDEDPPARGTWLEELPSSPQCVVVHEHTEAVLKSLASDSLTQSILGPVLRLIRLASQGHQGVSEALERISEEFLDRVEARSNRPGGRDAAIEQWRRSLEGALGQVSRPNWLGSDNPQVCECWFDQYHALHRSTGHPFASKGQARNSENAVMQHLISWARSQHRTTVHQSQRQISLATTIRLETVNKAIARLVRQGWLVRRDPDEYGIQGLELVVPRDITGTPKDPRGLFSGVPVVNRSLHWLFSSNGLGVGVAETFSHLPEHHVRLESRPGVLTRVSPEIPRRELQRSPSSRPLPSPPRGQPPTPGELAELTGRTLPTIRRHLQRLARAGMAFEEDGRWWRYRTHPDWVAEQWSIGDPTPARRELYRGQRRKRYEDLAGKKRVIRILGPNSVTYADPKTGQVMWVDPAPGDEEQ